MKMVEVKTSELIGPALDWAVAKADGFPVQYSRRLGLHTQAMMDVSAAVKYVRMGSTYCPSQDWSQIGPLIEKYKLRLVPCDAGYFSYTDYMAFEGVGETALIAACRAIVYHKIGEVVSVPAELVNGGGL